MRRSLFSNHHLAGLAVVVAGLIAAPLGLATEKVKPSDPAKTNPATTENSAKDVEHIPYLGVAIEPLHPAFATHMPSMFAKGQGVMVAQVAAGSPAEKAGFKAHDVLMTYGDQKLFSPDQLNKLVQSDKAGADVKFAIVRDGKSEEITVKLGDFTPERQAGPDSSWSWRMPPWRWRTPEWFTQLPALPGTEDTNAKDSLWNNFDSLTVKRIGDDRFHVEIGFLDKDGKIEQRTFEGTREEIHKDIAAQKDLPAIERDHLLRSLDIPNSEFPTKFPGALFPRNHRGVLELPDRDTNL